MHTPGPIFAFAPAPLTVLPCAVEGSAVTLATWGLLLATKGQAFALTLTPNDMLVLGTVMARSARALGADPDAADQALSDMATARAAPVAVKDRPLA